MKPLVVFYSFEGNTRLIAENIAQAVNADLLELRTNDEPGTKGFLKYFLGGMQVMLKRKPALLPLTKDPQHYDIIFIGTPTWAGNYTPALRTFLSSIGLTSKKIALFCCYAGNPGKTLAKMAQALSGNTIIGELGVRQVPDAKETSCKKAVDWAKDLLNKLYFGA